MAEKLWKSLSVTYGFHVRICSIAQIDILIGIALPNEAVSHSFRISIENNSCFNAFDYIHIALAATKTKPLETDSWLYQITTENRWFSDIFRGYRSVTLFENGFRTPNQRKYISATFKCNSFFSKTMDSIRLSNILAEFS